MSYHQFIASKFLDTGLGKTNCELEWAKAVNSHTKKPINATVTTIKKWGKFKTT